MRILGVFPLVRSEEEIALRTQDFQSGFLDPGTEVDYRSVRFSGTSANSHYDLFLVEAGVLELAVSAEEEGYDAVCTGSVGDPAMLQLRSRLSIPVVGPGHVALHVASLLGTRVSIIATTPAWAFMYRRNLNLYEMGHKLASIRDISTPWTREGYYSDEGQHHIELLVEEGRKAIEKDGADVLMVGSTSMHVAVQAMQEALPVPVIDPQPWSLKIAESLVKLGVSHSKLAYASPAVDHDETLHTIADAARSAGS
jgi:allantoin racemase